MKYTFDSDNYVIKLQKGERLSEAIEQFVRATNIEGAWVNGLGGALEVTLGFYDLDSKRYNWRVFEGLRELVSLTGNLAFDEQGKPMFHFHGVLSDQQYQTIGGHIKDLVAGATVELFVRPIHKQLSRKTDPDIGLQTLDL